MNTKYTAVLLVVFLALAGAAYFAGRGRTPVDMTVGTATPTPAALFEVEPNDIQEVVLDGAGPNVTLGRVAGGWEVNGQPSDDTVESVVARLAKPVPARQLAADLDPETYGFATASLTVTLKTTDGTEHVLVFGDDAPVDSNVYVRLGTSGPIYLFPNSDAEMLKGWLTTPPYRPTATPEVVSTESATPGDATADATAAVGETQGPPGPSASIPTDEPGTPAPPRPPTPMPTEPKEPGPPPTDPPTGPTAESTANPSAEPTLGTYTP